MLVFTTNDLVFECVFLHGYNVCVCLCESSFSHSLNPVFPDQKPDCITRPEHHLDSLLGTTYPVKSKMFILFFVFIVGKFVYSVNLSDKPVVSVPLPTPLPDTVAQTLHSPQHMRRSSS